MLVLVAGWQAARLVDVGAPSDALPALGQSDAGLQKETVMGASAVQVLAAEIPSDAATRLGAIAPPDVDDASAQHDTRVPRDDSESPAEAEGHEQRIRAMAIRELGDSYYLLFDEMELTAVEREGLLDYLVDVRIRRTYRLTANGVAREGVETPAHERANRIREIVGDEKAQMLLEREDRLFEYRETRRIDVLLDRAGLPLAETQRDRLLATLLDVRAALDAPVGMDDVDGTYGWLEDRERRVMELAPSFLTPQQVVFLDEQYQQCSRERTAFLERWTRIASQNPDAGHVPGYPPCVF